MAKKWISGAIKHPGAFGKATAKKIAAGKKSKSPIRRKRAVLAQTLKKMAKARKAT